jgi:undecaprenyl-diphosphatase
VFFSNTRVWVALYALVLCFLFRRLGWKKALVAVAAIALTIVCCDQGANLFKNWICRLRPSHDAWMLSNGLHLPGDAGGLYGFFSGHAANSFGFAAASLGIFRSDARHSYKAYGWAIFIWAFLVSLSRIFLGRHFFGDILVGAAVGMLIGWLFALLYGRIADRL